MGLSVEMTVSSTYIHMAEELPAFVIVSQTRDNQILQQQVEKAAKNEGR